MGYARSTASDADVVAQNPVKRLNLRLICVLQQGGVDSPQALADYLSWAAAHGVRELCFKELYVSTTLASRYHAAPENSWSHAHQVPLAWLMQTLQAWGFVQTGELPWGAPVFSGACPAANGTVPQLRVAAYTEPSVFWERSHGLARSWNLMADGSCLASLEDPDSAIGWRTVVRGVAQTGVASGADAGCGGGRPRGQGEGVHAIRVHRAAEHRPVEAA